MARLTPCPSCGRHVRAVEHDCPFCGHAGLTMNAPSRLCVLLLGLSLAACTSPAAPIEAKPKPAEPELEVQPEPAVTPAPELEQPEPEPELGTTGADETTGGETTGSEGTDDGASAEPVIPKPRPQKKYGAPPRPEDDPSLESPF